MNKKSMMCSVIMLSFLTVTCGVSLAQQQGEPEAVAAPMVKAVNVGNKICPVMDTPIDEQSKVTYEYQGKIYNFCCPGCLASFKADPQKYIAKVEAELAAQQR